jgi:nicotinate-nucleotide pyrophosphorylase (carboxylating)
MLTNRFHRDEVYRIIGLALSEDRVHEDITSHAVIPAALTGKAELRAKASGVVAGLGVFQKVFPLVDRNIEVRLKLKDGDPVKPGDTAAVVAGPVRGILAAERTALNFVCHLSGIATLTAAFVAGVRGFPVAITDTRKTMPGMRRLEKDAVRAGGGVNHRFNLGDGMLVKDNHLAALRADGWKLADIVTRAKGEAPAKVKVQIEVTSLAEAEEATVAGADMLLLDNMKPAEVREIVSRLGKKVTLEASGGINLENVRLFAETGVHRVSIGALTHSAKALDFSLELTST